MEVRIICRLDYYEGSLPLFSVKYALMGIDVDRKLNVKLMRFNSLSGEEEAWRCGCCKALYDKAILTVAKIGRAAETQPIPES